MKSLLPLLNFAAREAAQNWQAVNDGVTGRVSSGRFRITDDRTLEFSGMPDQINGLGFMLSDKKAGLFKLAVERAKRQEQ
ncbi:MAG: hypothetical protein ACKOOF_06635 [Planctomycetaceae bacterium]